MENLGKGLFFPRLALAQGRGEEDFLKKSILKLSLYIKLEVGQTIKGGIGKIYWVCYPIFEKKETSCKEIG
jgi:hypothetical protein